MTLDRRFLRASCVCPFCTKPKEQGNLVCWSCYQTQGLRYGETRAQAKLLDTADLDTQIRLNGG